MKKITTFSLLTFFAFAVYAQDKKDMALSFTTGVFNSPYFSKATSGGFYSFGFDYHISMRDVLSINYFGGRHDYFDGLSNTIDFTNILTGTNAKATYNIFSVSYKYKVVNNKKLNIIPGLGIGVMTLSQQYPYRRGNSTDFERTSFSDIAFPITLDANYKLSAHWQLGLTGGFLLEPDYPVLGLHAGFKLSYILK